MQYLVCILIGYFMGCINPSYIIGKLRGVNIKKSGSGNAGASNALLLFGKAVGVFCALFDIIKAFGAIKICEAIYSDEPYIFSVTAVAAILGHIFPFYMKFRGGKGLASFWGMTVALNWKLGLIAALVILLATVITDYIVIGTFSTIALVPAYTGLVLTNWTMALIVFLASAMIFCKPFENIGRLIRKEELGLRSAIRGDNRIK